MLKHLKPVFLKWVLIMSLIGLGTVFAFFSTNLVSEINRVDFTKISFIIFGVFIISSIKTGILTYNASAPIHTNKSIERIIRRNETGWFLSDCFSFNPVRYQKI